MTKSEFDQLRIGGTVWTSFSNSYRRSRIISKEPRHAIVTAPAVVGNNPLERRARYQSLDLAQRYPTNAEYAAARKQEAGGGEEAMKIQKK